MTITISDKEAQEAETLVYLLSAYTPEQIAEYMSQGPTEPDYLARDEGSFLIINEDLVVL